MARDDRVYFHLYPVLVHLARTVGLPIEIVKYIRDEVRASGIRARQALKGHILAGGVLRWWLGEEIVLSVRRFGNFERQRAERWKSLRLNWTPRERRYWERLDRSRDPLAFVIYGNEYLDSFQYAA